MSDLIQIQLPTTIKQASRADQNPAAVYLASLSPGSRPTMRGALEKIALLIAGDDEAGLDSIPWHRIRFQHTAAIRAALADK